MESCVWIFQCEHHPASAKSWNEPTHNTSYRQAGMSYRAAEYMSAIYISASHRYDKTTFLQLYVSLGLIFKHLMMWRRCTSVLFRFKYKKHLKKIMFGLEICFWKLPHWWKSDAVTPRWSATHPDMRYMTQQSKKKHKMSWKLDDFLTYLRREGRTSPVSVCSTCKKHMKILNLGSAHVWRVTASCWSGRWALCSASETLEPAVLQLHVCVNSCCTFMCSLLPLEHFQEEGGKQCPVSGPNPAASSPLQRFYLQRWRVMEEPQRLSQ